MIRENRIAIEGGRNRTATPAMSARVKEKSCALSDRYRHKKQKLCHGACACKRAMERSDLGHEMKK
jgi:hypothetical protein